MTDLIAELNVGETHGKLYYNRVEFELWNNKAISFFFDDVVAITFKTGSLWRGAGALNFATNATKRKVYSALLGSNIEIDDGNILVLYNQNDAFQKFYEECLNAWKKYKEENTNSGAHNIADELKEYKSLCEQGVITDEEFQAKKMQLLGL